jgi:hypothetical protein
VHCTMSTLPGSIPLSTRPLSNVAWTFRGLNRCSTLDSVTDLPR